MRANRSTNSRRFGQGGEIFALALRCAQRVASGLNNNIQLINDHRIPHEVYAQLELPNTYELKLRRRAGVKR
jgi:hypothetical protein